jgi:hypothetical protein
MAKSKLPVLIRCLKKGCPRTKRIDRDQHMPPGCTEVHQDCPWHLVEGNKEYEQRYFVDGVEWWFGPKDWEPVHSS